MAYNRWVIPGVILALLGTFSAHSLARAQEPERARPAAGSRPVESADQTQAQPQATPQSSQNASPPSGDSQPRPVNPAGQPPSPSNGSAPSQPYAGRQTNRIMGVVPNYRAVSPDTVAPPLNAKGKFKLAFKDTFDYSSFISVGMLTTLSYGLNSTPQFGRGIGAYGTYFWHSMIDQTSGNFMTEAIVPSILHQDPRFYTMGRNHGRVRRRFLYAFEALFVSRSDAGKREFNYSEVIGNGIAASLSNLYYPREDRNLGHTASTLAEQIAVDGLSNTLKEFWPDIRRKVLHKKN